MSRVVIVDDDKDIRLVIRDILEGDGYTVDELAGGDQALAYLPVAPEPAVALIDLVLSGMSGMELLTTIAADARLHAAHAYVVCTARPHNWPEAFNQVLTDLGAPILDKPFDIEDLLGVVAAGVQRLPHQVSSDTFRP